MISKFNIANSVLVGMSQAVSVKPTRCSRMAHKNSKCNICETNCPTGAIKVGSVGTKIDIDWDKCCYCGICISACPTGVYGMRDIGFTGMLKKFIGKINDNGLLVLGCKELAADKGSVAAKVDCLGVFGLPEMLYFYTNGAKTIRFVFGECDSCVSKYGKELISEEIDELQKISEYFELLKGLEVTEKDNYIQINFTHQFDITKYDEEEESRLPKAEIVSRREMFAMLRSNATDTLARSAVLLTPQKLPERTLAVGNEKHLPAKRRIFLDSLVNLGKLLKYDTPVGNYFFEIKISSECNLCGICARFCPTGAIHMTEDKKGVNFTLSDCTVCGQCLIACYHKYITRCDEVDLRELFTPKSLFSEEKEES